MKTSGRFISNKTYNQVQYNTQVANLQSSLSKSTSELKANIPVRFFLNTFSCETVLISFIKQGDYIESYQCRFFVGLMSQCEGMHNTVKAGNVTALERKSRSVFRKHAAEH